MGLEHRSKADLTEWVQAEMTGLEKVPWQAGTGHGGRGILPAAAKLVLLSMLAGWWVRQHSDLQRQVKPL